MKPTAVERESFGTSAIDLFASGMGAFILIALVFMVLFAATPKKEVPSTPDEPTPSPPTPVLECPEIPECPECPEIPECPDCPELPKCPECPECLDCPPVPEPESPRPPPQTALEKETACPVCPVCPEPVAVLEETPAEPEAAVPEPEPPTEAEPPGQPDIPAAARPEGGKLLPDYDVVFVVDSTGSMRGEIDLLVRELHIVAEVLERIMPSVGIGIVTFNDRRQNPVGRHFALRRLTDDEEAMRETQRFLRSISVSDAEGPNPDTPEAVLAALDAAVATTFRNDVRNRSVIVITDAYAYEDEVEKTLELARTFSAVEGNRISVVHFRDNPDSEAYLRRLAEAGGGVFVPDRGSILANTLLGIL